MIHSQLCRYCLILVLSLATAGTIARGEPADSPGSGPSGEESLVYEGHVQLGLAGARRVIEAARQKAAEMNLAVNIAVVDDGGHLIAFARMDGARPASVATSLTKATAAATMRAATGPLPPGSPEVNVHLSLAVEHAAAASGGKFTTLKGGIPLRFGDRVIGAVGVGGATGEQDAEIGQAGADALQAALETAR